MAVGAPSFCCAAAMTATASCAIAVPERDVKQIATSANFFIEAELLLIAVDSSYRHSGWS